MGQNASRHPLLQVKNLRTYFPTSRGVVRAVDGVSLEIGNGESVGVVGESGSGKTVTALSIMRLVPPPGRIMDGSVVYNGTDLTAISRAMMERLRGKDIAMVFQDPFTFLNPVVRVGDQIAESLRLHQGDSKATARGKAIEALRRVQIPSPATVYNSYPHQLSGGMRQRALIAMAIACHPSLLIADEPTTALDVTVQAQILALLKQLQAELGMSLLLITHDLGVVAEVCDRVYVMYAGKVVEAASIYEIYDAPKHPYTQGLLRSVTSAYEFHTRHFETIPGVVPNLVQPPLGCRFHPRCPIAIDKCAREEPPLLPLQDHRLAACWRAE